MSDRLREARLRINDAHAGAPSEADVRIALDTLRPGLLADGGNVELRSVGEDGTVRLTLQGACAICPASEMTRRHVLEPYLRRKFQAVTSVIVDS